MKIKQQFSKCATVLAIIATIGQLSIAPAQAIASELEESNVETILEDETSTDTSSEETEETTEDSADVPSVTLPEIVTPVIEENQEGIVDLSPLQELKTFSAYTAEGDIIQSSQNRVSLFRDVGNSVGQLVKYYGAAMATTPYITISGVENGAVWCIEPDKPFPINLEYAQSVYQDEGIFNILYYAELNGWNQENENYVDVFVALNAYLGHSPFTANSFVTDPNVAFLLQKAQDKDAPAGSFDIENKVQTATFDSGTKLQKTDWYTPVSDSDSTTYDIPTDSFDQAVSVELSDGRVLQAKTGTHTISSQVKFRLVADASYENQIKFTINTNKLKRAALSFKPVSGDGQTVVKAGMVRDPLTVPDVTATFKAQLGKVKVAKTDSKTGQFIPGTVFDVTIEGKTYTVTTGADGTYQLPEEFTGGITGQIVEKSVPAGYVLDKTPIDFTITAAETVTVTQKNNIQQAVGAFGKKAEVFDAKKTKETGLPVYKYIPLEGAEFVIENSNDTTAPDQKSVLAKTGEYSDTIVTDDEGNGNSNIPFFNGKQNKYVIDEINEPNSYRQFKPVEFTVPYEVSSVDVATYDFGIFKNELKTGEVHFNKKDALDLGSIVNVAGAEFLIEGISANTADVNFVYTSTSKTDVLKLKAGEYKATEIKFPDGFTGSEDQPSTMIFTVSDKSKVEINWNNKKLQPKLSTQAYANEGRTDFDETVDNTFYDKISFENFESEKDLVTKLIGVETKTVYVTKPDVIAVDEKTGEAIVELFIPANTIKGGEDVVFVEYAFNKTEDGKLDDSEENLYAKHDDLSDKNQTIYNKTTKPTMSTQAYANDGKTNFDPTVDNKFYDKISYANFNGEKDLIIKLVGVETKTVYVTKPDVIAVDEKTGTALVELIIPANTIKTDEDVVFIEAAYNKTEDGKLDDSEDNLYVNHDDLFDRNQTLDNLGRKAPEKPTTLSTPSKTTTTRTGSLPSTGEEMMEAMMYVGMLIVAAVAYLFMTKNRKKA